MKLPVSHINIDDHQNLVYDLLNDPETIIFIDTNIIALLYRLNNKSREELFNFLKPFIEQNKVKVPNWVVNEYSNRFIREQILDYLSPLGSLKTITKEYNNIFDFLNMHIDEEVLDGDRRNTYSDINELKSDINELKNIFTKISFISKNKSADYVHKIHSNIETILNTCHIESDLGAILSEISLSANFRYNHKLPPGFQDSTKDLNEFGDLIIWKEILIHSQNNNNKKVLFLTNDAKKDWVYAPIKITENGRIKNNSEPKYKIIDPRLVHEFRISTASDDIEIISFDNFIKLLIQKHPGNFIELGRSLQLINNLDNPQEQTNNTDSENSPLSELPIVETSEIVINPEIVDSADSFNLDDTAFADKYIDLSNEDDLLSRTIIGLKSYNWYTQNPTIDNFIEEVNNYAFNKSVEEQNKLFVIGRNIYQAACGSSASAIRLLSDNLNQFIQRKNDYLINLVIAGMVYEIYFNSENLFRENRLKSQFINELHIIDSNPRLMIARGFIIEKLLPYNKNLIYIPFSNVQIQMEVVISENLIEVEDWLDGKVLFNKIEKITYNELELLTDDSANRIEIYQAEFTKFGIKDLICTSYGIPSNKLDLVYHNFHDNYKLIFRGLYLKKKLDIIND